LSVLVEYGWLRGIEGWSFEGEVSMREIIKFIEPINTV